MIFNKQTENYEALEQLERQMKRQKMMVGSGDPLKYR